MTRPKLPDFSAVIRLAEQTDCRVSLKDLARMHKHGEYSEQAVSALWPNASVRFRAFCMGLTRYEGGACSKCGGTLRYVKDCNCVVCFAKHMRDYYAARPELKKAENARWYQQNKQYAYLVTKARRAKIKEMQSC